MAPVTRRSAALPVACVLLLAGMLSTWRPQCVDALQRFSLRLKGIRLSDCDRGREITGDTVDDIRPALP